MTSIEEKLFFLRNRTKVYVHNHDKVFCSVFEPFCFAYTNLSVREELQIG